MTVLITGASRGIGWACAKCFAERGDRVILGIRRPDRLASEQKQWISDNRNVICETLDVSSEKSIGLFFLNIKNETIEILINNAGILPDHRGSEWPSTAKMLKDAFTTNVVGPYLLIQKVLPSMLERKFGRVVNVSSQMGSLKGMGTGSPAYRISKTALNALTVISARQTKGHGVLVNAICPDWVSSDMGGKGAPRTPEQAVPGILWAATLPNDGPTGGFFRDGIPLEW